LSIKNIELKINTAITIFIGNLNNCVSIPFHTHYASLLRRSHKKCSITIAEETFKKKKNKED